MEQVTIKNSHLELKVLSYGAIIQELWVINKKGIKENIVVGLKKPQDYLKDTIFLGACVGRFAGRITKGGFFIDGNHYKLHSKEGIHLHGGKKGFGKRNWKISSIEKGQEPFVTLEYTSAHLEEGYPGTLKVSLTYKLINNSLQIVHQAVTDKTTVVNLTNHSYFRLDETENLGEHYLKLNCEKYVETDSRAVPTGKILRVENTAYDFRETRSLKEKGLDTPFICKEKDLPVAIVYSKYSGIRMQVKSNQAAVVIYTPPSFPAVCFEVQNYPDAPNNKNFPSSLLHPGETYKNEALFIFDLVP